MIPSLPEKRLCGTSFLLSFTWISVILDQPSDKKEKDTSSKPKPHLALRCPSQSWYQGLQEPSTQHGPPEELSPLVTLQLPRAFSCASLCPVCLWLLIQGPPQALQTLLFPQLLCDHRLTYGMPSSLLVPLTAALIVCLPLDPTVSCVRLVIVCLPRTSTQFMHDFQTFQICSCLFLHCISSSLVSTLTAPILTGC